MVAHVASDSFVEEGLHGVAEEIFFDEGAEVVGVVDGQASGFEVVDKGGVGGHVIVESVVGVGGVFEEEGFPDEIGDHAALFPCV